MFVKGVCFTVKYVKRSIILALICAVVLTGIPVVNAQYYSDVSKSALTREEFDSIMYVSDNGIMVGSDTGEFMPNAYVNRAQFVQVLFSNSGEKDYYYAGSTDFTDVIEGSWYYDAVCWAYDRGLVSGTSSTTFDPARTITTAEVLAILYKYAEYMGTNTECRYESQPILSHSDHDSIVYWAEDAMNWALDYNILNPASAYAPLNPTAYAKRKAIAVFMRNYEKEAVGINGGKVFKFQNDEKNFYENPNIDNIFALSNKYYNLLCAAVENYYGEDSPTAQSILDAFDYYRTEYNWGGACLGMCSAILYDSLGKIDFNGNIEAKESMFDISIPKDNLAVRDGIHYYQMAAYADQYYRTDFTKASGTLETGLRNLQMQVKLHGATIVEYRWEGNEIDGEIPIFGHAIIVKTMTAVDGGYELEIYDPSRTTDEDDVDIIEDDIKFCGKILTSFGYYSHSALNTLEYLDIDGTYNEGVAGTAEMVDNQVLESNVKGEDYLEGNALIIVPAVDFTITNAEGEYMYYRAESTSGTMDIYSCKTVANGPLNIANLVLVVDESTSFVYTAPNLDEQFLFITSDLFCSSVEGKNFDTIYVNGNSVDIHGNSIEALVTKRLDTESREYINISAQAETRAEIEWDNNMIIVDGRSEGING